MGELVLLPAFCFVFQTEVGMRYGLNFLSDAVCD